MLYVLAAVFCLISSLACSAQAAEEAGRAKELARVTADDESTPPGNPCAAAFSAAERQLYRLIMGYRASKGLPAIPVSPSLTYVAQIHVRDLQAHPPSGKCNFHSWSADGRWTRCCYTDDHARAQCMWDKPRELTSYRGSGYEIASWSSGPNDPATALSGWKSSPLHAAVIVNSGTWTKIEWKAIGVGICGSYAVVWFGEEPDPCK